MKKGKKLIVLFALANVLLFLLLFSSATWSWISVGTSSDVNVINSSHFNFDVTVKNSENVEIVIETARNEALVNTTEIEVNGEENTCTYQQNNQDVVGKEGVGFGNQVQQFC